MCTDFFQSFIVAAAKTLRAAKTLSDRHLRTKLYRSCIVCVDMNRVVANDEAAQKRGGGVLCIDD